MRFENEGPFFPQLTYKLISNKMNRFLSVGIKVKVKILYKRTNINV